MRKEFRISVLQNILKTSGVVSDLVDEALEQKSNLKFNTLGSVGTGTTVMAPSSVVKPDGTVNVVVQIRGLAGGDAKTATQMGTNAVIITCEAGGMGSKENLAAFGNTNFINTAVSKVLEDLQKKNPDKKVRLGKLTISSFSGGGSATANLLVNRANLPKGTSAPKFVFIDGLHAEPDGSVMKEIVNYAKQVKDNPEAGQLSIVHTAVVPTGYASTTQVADYLLNSLGLQKQRVADQGSGDDVHPVAEANQGGLRVVQLYDQNQPYMVKDPASGELKPNVPGTAGYQHIKANDWGLRNAVG
jgi:hypothetical protein